MFDAGALFVRLEARDAKLASQLNAVDGELRQVRDGLSAMENRASDSFRAAGRSAALFGVAVSKAWDLASFGVTFLLRNMGRLASASLGLASDAGELGSKFDFVFGQQAAAARKELDAFGERVGRSSMDLQTMASGMQSILVPMGFARTTATDLSLAMTKLATDIGSFNNESDTEVMDALKSAMIGNAEAVRKYGVVISEVTLNQELMRMGVAKGTAGATEQQKAIARLSLIMKGTKDAQGDAARTSGSFANQTKALWAVLQDLGVEVGNILVPAMTVFIGAAKEALVWITGNIDSVKSWGDTFKSWAQAVVDAVKFAIVVVTNYDLAWETTMLAVEQAFTMIAERVRWFASNSWESVRWFFTNFADMAKTVADNYYQMWLNVFLNFSKVVSQIWDVIRSGGKRGFTELVDIVTKDMKDFTSSPEWEEFKGTDFSDRWAKNREEWKKKMDEMKTDAKKSGEDTKKALDLQDIFDKLTGSAAGGKAAKTAKAEVKVEFTGLQELFKKNLLARFEEDGAKKAAAAQIQAAAAAKQLVELTKKNHTELVEAVKSSGGVGA